MPSIRRNFPEQSDVTMRYFIDGSGSPPIVLVHGFGCANDDWDHQRMNLSRTHQVITCDLPGHGASTREIRGCRVEELGHHVADLLKAEDLKDTYLVGHSMGCRVVMQAYLDTPGRVSGLVLVDGSWIGQGDPVALEASARQAFEGGAGFSSTVAALFDDMFLDNADPTRTKAVIERAGALDPELGTTLFASVVAWDATHTATVIPEIGCRLLVIQSTYLNERRQRIALAHGETTPWLDLVRAAKPDAHIEVIPGVGHFTMFEAPAKVSALIDEFSV